MKMTIGKLVRIRGSNLPFGLITFANNSCFKILWFGMLKIHSTMYYSDSEYFKYPSKYFERLGEND